MTLSKTIRHSQKIHQSFFYRKKMLKCSLHSIYFLPNIGKTILLERDSSMGNNHKWGAQMVSFLPPILFFHSANKLKFEHFCSISQFLRRRFRQISLRKIILLTLISVRKTLKNFFLFR